MYLSFYGLREAPFAPTPDPKFLFQSPRHREALAQLIYGVRERKRFIVLTGETGTGKTTLLLVGQPELRDKLNLPELRQLKQRVGLRCHIAALSPEETRQYIRHRLRIAGATDAGIFSDAAIQKISDYSQGTPRVINIVCDHCLLSGYADSKRRIDAGIVQEAVEYLEEGERREWKRRRSISLVPSQGAVWAARSGVAL